VPRQFHSAHMLIVLHVVTRASILPNAVTSIEPKNLTQNPDPGICHERATHQKAFQSTFIAEEPKNRKKARLSWYHPDDTVRLELCADTKYHFWQQSLAGT